MTNDRTRDVQVHARRKEEQKLLREERQLNILKQKKVDVELIFNSLRK